MSVALEIFERIRKVHGVCYDHVCAGDDAKDEPVGSKVRVIEFSPATERKRPLFLPIAHSMRLVLLKYNFSYRLESFLG